MVNKGNLPALLAEARQQLHQAQLRVAALEAEVGESARADSTPMENHDTSAENQMLAEAEQEQRWLRAELQATKEQLKAILDLSPQAILLVDTTLHIQRANGAFQRLFAQETKAWIDCVLTDLIMLDDVARVSTLINQVSKEGGGQSLAIRAQRLDGAIFNAELSVGLCKGNGFVCTIRDTTEHKKQDAILQESERQLHASQKMLQLILDTIPVRVFWKDRDSILLGCNHLFAADAGVEGPQALIGLHHTQLTTVAVEAEAYRIDDLLVMESGITKLDYEETISLPGHGTRWIQTSKLPLRNEAGDIIGVLGTYTDITGRKETQDALVESEARYRLLVETIIDVISIVDEEGIRTFITPSCYDLLGYRPDELLGTHALDLMHPEDHQPILALIDQALAEAQSAVTLTYRLRHKAGHYLWVEVTASFRNAPKSSTTHSATPNSAKSWEMIGVMRDITERKRTEAVLAARMDEEREFQGYLKALHEITLELTQLADLDTFYRRVVEYGRHRLGFERIAFFLYDDAEGSAVGTYGVNAQGQIVNAQQVRFTPSTSSLMFYAARHSERFYFAENITLYDDKQPVGIGWNAATVLWNGPEKLGWLVTDNLLQQKPATKPQLDTLGLYGLTVGALLTQKRIQMAMRESEARYRLLAENITDVVLRINTAHTYVYVSPSSQAVLGYAPASLIGQSVFTHVHPDDLAIVEQALLAAEIPDTQNGRMMIRYRHQRGDYLWLEVSGQVIHSAGGDIESFIASARNISARKHVEDALQESEAKYRHLIENMRSGLAVYDIDNRVTYVNDRACELFGYTRAQIIGQSPFDYATPANEEIIEAQLARRRLLERSSYELTINHKDGNTVYLLIDGAPLLDKHDSYNGGLIVMTDITMQKKAEEALRQALAKEKELSELKSRFVTMASHEFRTPLASILALTETLSNYRHRLSDEQIEQRLAKIKGQIDHLKNIMEDVLLLARMQARRFEFSPTVVELVGFCRTLLDEFQESTGEMARLQYSSQVSECRVQVDAKLMRQILSNLVSNAVKYSPADTSIQVNLALTEGAFVLQVRDRGIGIPAADVNHLFEPFHRAANVGAISGTGLGLVIAKEAVELHGGTLTIESEINQGTTCTIRIPHTTLR